MNSENEMTLAKLRDELIAAFSLQELDNLCFDLSIRYESLPGNTIDAKAKELVAYCQRRRRLPDLVRRLQQLRPAVAWRVPKDAPLLDAAEPDTAVIEGCREMITQIVDRVLAAGERMNSRLLATKVPAGLQLTDLFAYDAGLETALAIYQDGGCAHLRQVAAPILSERQAMVQAERSRLRAKGREYGIQVPLALRRQMVLTEIQLGLLELLAQQL